MLVTAVTKSAKKTILSSGDYGPFGGYDCPVYKYSLRTDKYHIMTVTLPTQDHKPLHWTLRGVALLCATA
jgi:dynein heavy chain